MPTRLDVSTGIACPILFVRGSTLATATATRIEVTNQTPASPAAIPLSSARTTRAATVPVAGTTLETAPSGSTPHTARRPTASPLTPNGCAGAAASNDPGRRTVLVTAVDAGSTRDTATVAAPVSISPLPVDALPT